MEGYSRCIEKRYLSLTLAARLLFGTGCSKKVVPAEAMSTPTEETVSTKELDIQEILAAEVSGNYTVAVTKDASETLRGLLYGGVSLSQYDDAITPIVIEEASACITGEKTPGKTAALIQNRVQIYLSKQGGEYGYNTIGTREGENGSLFFCNISHIPCVIIDGKYDSLGLAGAGGSYEKTCSVCSLHALPCVLCLWGNGTYRIGYFCVRDLAGGQPGGQGDPYLRGL
jgi:hypothetical protein